MGSEFFELPAEEQQKSLTAFAHELLTNYGISNAKVSCISKSIRAHIIKLFAFPIGCIYPNRLGMSVFHRKVR